MCGFPSAVRARASMVWGDRGEGRNTSCSRGLRDAGRGRPGCDAGVGSPPENPGSPVSRGITFCQTPPPLPQASTSIASPEGRTEGRTEPLQTHSLTSGPGAWSHGNTLFFTPLRGLSASSAVPGRPIRLGPGRAERATGREVALAAGG